MTQTDIFKQEKATERAITIAGNFADQQWYSEAIAALDVLCKRGEDFTTDELWRLLEGVEVKTLEPRAMGDVIRRAARSHKIFSTGGYRKSIRKECHRRPLAIWRPVGYKRVIREAE